MSGTPRRSRRSWSVDFKRRVVAEASEPGVSAAAVARRYDLNANLVFNWRRRYGGDGSFLPIAVTSSTPAAGSGDAGLCAGEIEITLATGHRVRIRGGFDADRVARLLRGLMR